MKTILRFSPITLLSALACLTALPHDSTAGQAQEQVQRQARMVFRLPMKIDIRPLAQGRKVGQKVPVELILRNAENEPSKTSSNTTFTVQIIGPSGKSQWETVSIQDGESSTKFEFLATEAGLTTIKARQINDELMGGSNNVLIAPASSASKRAKSRASKKTSSGTGMIPQPYGARAASLQLAKFSSEAPDQGPAGEPPAPADSPMLLLRVSGGEGSEILADGKAGARISAYYMDPDGQAAPMEIKIWLQWTNGDLAPVQPLRIKKGEFSGEALLTSRWPTTATVSFVGSSPKYKVNGPVEFQIKFVPPIYGIALVGTEKLSLVDSEVLIAQFFDAQGNPVQTGSKRTVTFINMDSKMHLKPITAEVSPGLSQTSTVLLPVGLGRTELQAFTPGYARATHVVVITGGLIFSLWAIGGIVGGLAAFNTFKGSLFWRLFLGIVAAAVLTWGYVYGALPLVESTIAHNTISVLFVSIIGGYLGIQVLDLVSKKLGFLQLKE